MPESPPAAWICEGVVRHHRRRPFDHRFTYPLFMLMLDLDRLDEALADTGLFSARRPTVAWFRRRDHFGDPDRPLAACVRETFRQQLGFTPDGPIRLVTQPRTFGFNFNPVSFYYAWDAADENIVAIAAEVHNTPWHQRHVYTLDRRHHGPDHEFTFDKAFHVSPFMPMNQRYRWRLTDPAHRFAVHMVNEEAGEDVFSAAMVMTRRPATRGRLAVALMKYPLM
ncbi:MAG: DUF1365 domain-containing protein, partial [Phycisphaeraceae bacterium]|nr:DUF1365 domain-containing protein [Phycisphaeraceae bacterium]